LHYLKYDAAQPLIAARAGLTGGDIHRDLKTKTHIGEAGGGPLHTRPPRWWFNRALALLSTSFETRRHRSVRKAHATLLSTYKEWNGRTVS
jgi:hypothetical protein